MRVHLGLHKSLSVEIAIPPGLSIAAAIPGSAVRAAISVNVKPLWRQIIFMYQLNSVMPRIWRGANAHRGTWRPGNPCGFCGVNSTR